MIFGFEQNGVFLTTSILPFHFRTAVLATESFLFFRRWCFLKMISMTMRPRPPTMPTPTKMKTPLMLLRPNVAGELSSLESHFTSLFKRIHLLSKSSIFPLSWKSRMASVILSAQGEPFCNPTPYPLLPKRSPAVMRSQSRAASNSRRELSQMKALSTLELEFSREIWRI